MGLTSSMYTALTGLNASQQRLDVAGNNIANVNTTAFRGSRVMFQTQLYRTMSSGSAPTDNSGGTNPVQFGMGTGLGAVQKNMSGGMTETTGVKTDVAIQGNGFFVLKTPNQGNVYTRDGSFTLDTAQKLTSADGYYVQGYTVDDSFNIISGTMSDLTIPEGNLSVARATTTANFVGNLNSSGTIATTPGTVVSAALVDRSTGLAATGATLLTNLATAAAPGVALFAADDVANLDATKGAREGLDGRSMATSGFTVTAASTADADSGSTVDEFMEWIQTQTAIDTTVAQNPPAGVTIDGNGQINVVGNLGEENNLALAMTSTGASPVPMTFTSTAGDGTSAYTSFLVYDSLGNPVQVDLTFVMESKATTGNIWRFFAESAGDSDAPYLGTGTVTFDTAGNYVSSTGTDLVINRADLGSVDPITLRLDLSMLQGLNAQSNFNMKDQNGFPTGTLVDFSVGNDGIILGSFSNGMNRQLGQIVMANFSNPEGLIAQANNNFIAGPDSGEPSINTPGNFGLGTLLGGTLELSNVDLTQEFITMVSATTAFSAAGKVISTSNQMLSELMTLIR